MNHSKALAFAALCCLVIALAVATSQPVMAQGGGGKVSDVRVINAPVVQIAHEPFYVDVEALFPDGSGVSEEKTLVTVPDGKVLVIEDCSWYYGGTGLEGIVFIDTTTGKEMALVPHTTGTNPVGTGKPTFRVPAGHTLIVRGGRNNGTGPGYIHVLVNGFYEPAL